MKKKYKNNLSCTLHYKSAIRKCFAQDFRHMQLKLPEAVQREWKLWCNMNIDSLEQISQNEWHGHTICATGERINYSIIDRKDRVAEAARLLGQMGGQAGRGKSKVRGDSNYYRLLRMKREVKKLKK